MPTIEKIEFLKYSLGEKGSLREEKIKKNIKKIKNKYKNGWLYKN